MISFKEYHDSLNKVDESKNFYYSESDDLNGLNEAARKAVLHYNTSPSTLDVNKPSDKGSDPFYYKLVNRYLKTLQTTSKSAKDIASELRDLIYPHEREGVENFRHVGDIDDDGNKFMVFQAECDNPRYNKLITAWICTDFKDDALLEKFKAEYPVGTILVHSFGYSMVLFDFYRIDKYDKHTMILSKLGKKGSGFDRNFRTDVVPTNEVKETKKVRIMGLAEGHPYIRINSYGDRIYFNKDRLYDKRNKYTEDHAD